MSDYDVDDPLQMLLREWQQSGFWFWVFLAVGAAAMILLPRVPLLGLFLVGAGAGQLALKLGHVLIVAANELRKELRASRRPLARDEAERSESDQRRR